MSDRSLARWSFANTEKERVAPAARLEPLDAAGESRAD
jgi:hypothetical protein